MFGFLFVFTVATSIFIYLQTMHNVRKNREAPVLTVEARVVDKREEFHERRTYGGFDYPAETCYYAVFEVESGDRMKFSISVNEYWALTKEDFGKLTFKGTRFGSFKRI